MLIYRYTITENGIKEEELDCVKDERFFGMCDYYEEIKTYVLKSDYNRKDYDREDDYLCDVEDINKILGTEELLFDKKQEIKVVKNYFSDNINNSTKIYERHIEYNNMLLSYLSK